MDLWDELLALTEADPAFRFLMDGQTVVIEDYLAVRDQARSRLDRAVANGRIEVGPWYTLPDEFLVSGEALVRNLERGLRIGDAHGGAMRVGYLPDTFGHAAQMPQVYRQFGFRHAAVWRGVPLEIDRVAFDWESPDGSRVLTAYLGASYSHGADLPVEGARLAARLRLALGALAGLHPGDDVLLMNGNDHVRPQARLSQALPEAAARLDGTRVRLAGLQDYLARLPESGWPRWRGELRASSRANVLMGTLSNRIPDKQAYFGAGLQLERYAEPMAALSGLALGGLLHQAWTLILQNAAHDTACGSGIDAVADESRVRSRAAFDVAAAVSSRAAARLVDQRAPAADLPCAWNPSPFPRGDLVETLVETVPEGGQDLGPAEPAPPAVYRFAAAEVSGLLTSIDERRILGEAVRAVRFDRQGPVVVATVEAATSGSGIDIDPAKREAEAFAVRPGVETFELRVMQVPLRRALLPSGLIHGTATARIEPHLAAGPARAGANLLENDRLRCQVADDGTLLVEDLTTGTHYAGLHRLTDEGDAGDEYNFSPVERGITVDQPESAVSVRTLEDGPWRAALEVVSRYRIPSELSADRRSRLASSTELPVRVVVSIRAGSPQLDFDVSLVNQAKDHRLRVHLPLPFQATASYADTPFHVTRRPAVVPRREPGAPEWELPTYPMRTFVDVSDGLKGVALITEGLHEYELVPGPPAFLALALLRAVGWLSRDDLAYRAGHAGPALKTPEAQVQGEQRYRYSLHFHAGDWEAAGIWRVAESTLLPFRVLAEGTPRQPNRSITLEPETLQMTALVPLDQGYDLRVLNASMNAHDGVVRIAPRPEEVTWITLGGEVKGRLAARDGAFSLPLRPWEIATLRVRV